MWFKSNMIMISIGSRKINSRRFLNISCWFVLGSHIFGHIGCWNIRKIIKWLWIWLVMYLLMVLYPFSIHPIRLLACFFTNNLMLGCSGMLGKSMEKLIRMETCIFSSKCMAIMLFSWTYQSLVYWLSKVPLLWKLVLLSTFKVSH